MQWVDRKQCELNDTLIKCKVLKLSYLTKSKEDWKTFHWSFL